MNKLSLYPTYLAGMHGVTLIPPTGSLSKFKVLSCSLMLKHPIKLLVNRPSVYLPRSGTPPKKRQKKKRENML